MDEKEFRHALCLAIAFYASGDNSYTSAMDDLVTECTDEQWAEAEAMIDEVTDLLRESRASSENQE